MALEPNPILGGPWRILVLDRNPEDPKWLIATVEIPLDVKPALIDLAGRYGADWQKTTDWVREVLGKPHVSLVGVADPLVWRIDEGGKPR